jgi:hypothetical protein
MAKTLLVKVLTDVLGKYVEGLEPDNLKLGVWSGKIQLFNLKLRENALDDLNLPIRIVRGSLKSLIVKVPWTSLDSKPVEVYLDGIYATIAPLDLTKFTADDARKLNRAEKSAALSAIDKHVMASVTKEKVQDVAKKASYLQQLVTHIVDNLEVNIRNIHIRYEDNSSDKKNVFAAGLTLDEISLSTTDAGWEVKYVKRDVVNPASGVIHKLAVIQNCGVYWNPKAERSLDKPYDLWEEYMLKSIYKSNGMKPTAEFVYILNPKNTLSAKMTHSEHSNESTPNVDVLIECTTFDIDFDRLHFRQLMLVVDSFGELQKRKYWAIHRPQLRPNVDPRAWWFYAYRIVSGRDISFANQMRTMTLCMKARKRYITLVKQLKIKEARNPPEKLDASSEEELITIEETLPLSALAGFRETAMKEVAVEIEAIKNSGSAGKVLSLKPTKHHEKHHDEKEKKKGFFSGWFSSSSNSSKKSPASMASTSGETTPSPRNVKGSASPVDDDDAALMQDVENKFKKMEEESHSAVSSSFAFRLRLVSSAKLALTFDHAPMVDMTNSLGVSVEVRSANLFIRCDFANVAVTDHISSTPYNREILQMMKHVSLGTSRKSGNSQKKNDSQFGVDVSIVQEKVQVKVSALPFLFTWNEECMRKIVQFFVIEDHKEPAVDSALLEKNFQSQVKFAEIHSESTVEVELHIHAPKFCIPENPKFEERCLLLDAGFLAMTGKMDSNGMRWDIGLNNINIAMPLTKKAAVDPNGAPPESYLIKPFDINIAIHNTDKTEADMNISGQITPAIKAEFDAVKIVRLTQAMLLIVGTFAEEGTEKKMKEIKDATPAKTKERSNSQIMSPQHAEVARRMTSKSVVMNKSTDEKDMKPVNPLLKINFQITGFECMLKIVEEHYAVLRLSNLNFSMLDRQHDSLMDFTMSSLELTDSVRFVAFKDVISAKAQDGTSDSNLVHVRYLIIKDRHSPSYDGFQSVIDMNIADINAFIDPYTTDSYHVLVKDLVSSFNTHFKNTKIAPVEVPTFESSSEHKPIKPTELKGIRLQFSLSAIGVHFLNKLHPNAPELEDGFSFSVKGLKADIKTGDLVSGQMSLATLELVDIRKKSSHLFYKKIVESDITKDASFDAQEGIHHLVDLDFHQDNATTTFAEIKVRALTTTIAIDIIMDFVNLVLANINAVMGVLSCAKFEDVETPKVTHTQTRRKSSAIEEYEEGPHSSVFVNVSISNPYLILLEDPASEHSKAIAATCEIVLQYSQDGKADHDGGQETNDTIHIALQQAEVFVLLDNSVAKVSHRIVEPTALQFHMKSTVVKTIPIVMDISLLTEEIFVRASLNDIVLGMAIGQRFSLQSDQAFTEMEDVSMKAKVAEEALSNKNNLTMNKIRVHLAKAQIVLINDYNGQSNPLIRIEASAPDDYYNADLALWEPLLEKWDPEIQYQQGLEGKELTIFSKDFVQINVTGMLIKCVFNALNLISKIGEEGTYGSRQESYPLTIRNQLGIPVEVYDAHSKKLVLKLDNESSSRIPQISQASKHSRVTREKEFSRTFEVKFGGEYSEAFNILKDLRLDIHKPKLYQVMNSRNSALQKATSTYAPVVEEVYQYQRFNLLKNSWEAPWVNVGEPHEWSDAVGKGNKPPNTINCPKDWEWMEPEWKIDMNGTVGKDFDKDGFEYGFSFNAFDANNKRRVKQASDTVRRRKWTRTRFMRQVATTQNFTGRVAWQIISNPDETKQLLLRSTKVVENRFSVGIEIGLESTFSGNKFGKTFKVFPNNENSFPLLNSEEAGVRVRLQSYGCSWSEPFPLVPGKDAIASSEKETVGSSGGGETETFRFFTCRCDDNRTVTICLMAVEKDGILKLVVSPLLEITNSLPCDMQYKSQGMTEDMTILSGGKLAAAFYDVKPDLNHFFRLGVYTASGPLKFPKRGKTVEEILNFYSRDKASAVALKLELTTLGNGLRQISAYSSMLVVDRTGLGALLSSKVPSDSASTKKIDWDRRTLPRQSSIGEAPIDNDTWVLGKNGLTFFSPSEDTFRISLANGNAALPEIDKNTLNMSKSSLDAPDKTRNRCYHISLKREPYSVAPDLCSVLTLMPTFHIVNCLGSKITLCQRGLETMDKDKLTEIQSNSTCPWHGLSTERETGLFIKTPLTAWSIGAVNINEIGTVSMMLPLLPQKDSSISHVSSYMVLNVEIKFSDPKEFSYITVVIWESRIWRDPVTDKVLREGNVNLSIKNDSIVPLVIRQKKVEADEWLAMSHSASIPNAENEWYFMIPPNEWRTFGYFDPEGEDEFEFAVGPSVSETIGNPITIDLTRVGLTVPLVASNDIRLKIQIRSNNNGKVISIRNDEASAGQMTTASKKKNFDAKRQNDFILKLILNTICVSVIADKPIRRELFALALLNLSLEVRQITATKDQDAAMLLEFKLQDIQMDNFCEAAVYPILLQTDIRKQIENSKKHGKNETPNFIEFSLVIESPSDQTAPVIDYVACRILELFIYADSASILIAACDLLSFVAYAESSDEQFALSNAESFNVSLVKSLEKNCLYDVPHQYKGAQGQKLFIERLVIHPMKFTLDFYPNSFPRDPQELSPSLRWLTRLESVIAVEKFHIKINSFIAENIMEPMPILMERIGDKIVRDLQGNLIAIAGNLIGSLNLLGNPAGLYNNIGGGVQDFFYEPYTGLMTSPTDFLKGVGKGTKGLLTGITSGVVTSASNIVGGVTGGVATVGKNVAVITGDDKYLKKREQKRAQLKANKGGIMEGFKAGGESIASGFSSGMSGLITKPMEEAHKGGAFGFVKGLGQGIVGAAIKPVIGVSEGISNVVQGINNEIGDTSKFHQFRPARTFHRRDKFDDTMILIPIDFFASHAQKFVNEKAFKKDEANAFYAAIYLGYDPNKLTDEVPVGFALSEKFLYLLSKNFKQKWFLPVSSIAYILLCRDEQKRYGLKLVTYEQSGAASTRFVLFENRRVAIDGYETFYRFRFCFGQPNEMHTVGTLLTDIEGAPPPTEKKKHHSAHSSAAATVGSVSEGEQQLTSPPPASGQCACQEESTIVNNATANSSSEVCGGGNMGGGIGVGGGGSGKHGKYEFGTANRNSLKLSKMENVADAEFLPRYTYMFKQQQVTFPMDVEAEYGYHKLLDDLTWRVISNWVKNHDSFMSPSRCCGCLVLNYSPMEIQILDCQLPEGNEFSIMGVGSGYNATSKSIGPFGGAAFIFATGKRPSLFSLEHVKVLFQTTAFKSMVATRDNRSTCDPLAGFTCSFLEKSRTDWWSKYVICVK